MRLLAAVLLAFVASAASGTAWIVAGPGELRGRAFLVVLLVPLVWAGFMVHAYWDRRPWRPAVTQGLICVLCGTVVFLSDPLA